MNIPTRSMSLFWPAGRRYAFRQQPQVCQWQPAAVTILGFITLL